MKVHLVCYEDMDSWILGKIATRLRETLVDQGISCGVSQTEDSSADINHHICYISWSGQCTTIDTLMITHIDTETEFERVRYQLARAAMGVCMSRETMTTLANRGLDRAKLCFINPAIDGNLPPRRIAIGIASRLYKDGRKREGMLLDIAQRISPDDFSFRIIGRGWDGIVAKLRSKEFSVQYDSCFNHEAYAQFMTSIDYYAYFGLDEGSIGFLDALACGVPTIVTPQGFHLDVVDGVTYSFTEVEDLERILAKLAKAKRCRQRSVAGWTWEDYARKHAAVWTYLLARKAGVSVPKNLHSLLEDTGVEAGTKPQGLLAALSARSVMKKFLRPYAER